MKKIKKILHQKKSKNFVFANFFRKTVISSPRRSRKRSFNGGSLTERSYARDMFSRAKRASQRKNLALEIYKDCNSHQKRSSNRVVAPPPRGSYLMDSKALRSFRTTKSSSIFSNNHLYGHQKSILNYGCLSGQDQNNKQK